MRRREGIFGPFTDLAIQGAIVVTAILLLSLLFGMASCAVATVHADPFITAYTTDDPVNPDRMGLATIDGRYQIEIVPDWCGWNIQAGQNVTLQSTIAPFRSPITEDGIGYFKLTLDDRVDCLVYAHQLMDTTPCDTNSNGDCDVGMTEQGP